MEFVLLYATALLIGAAHTFEPDHVAAVGSFVVRRPRPRVALTFGLRWALGHGGVILVVGTGLVALRLALPDGVGTVLERLVGATLVVLGLWVVAGARGLHRHADGTVHVHRGPARWTEPGGPDATEGVGTENAGSHGHAATAVGALHGLAGTGSAVALLPLATFDSALAATGWFAAFGLGTALSMALCALAAGAFAERAAARSAALGRGLARLAGVGTVLVGVVWMIG